MLKFQTKSIRLALGFVLAFSIHARADFSYQQTSRVTGGSMLKFLSMIGGRATQPITTMVSIKGDKMAFATPHTVSIIDLEAKTVTALTLDRKTYSVMTFDEVKADMESDKTSDGATITDFRVEMKDGPGTKTVLDKETREKVVTVLMTAAISSDKNVNTQLENHIYPSTEIEGYRELKSFYKRLGNLEWSPGWQGLNNPEMNKALAGLFVKMREMEGLPLLTVTTVSGAIPGIPSEMSDLQNASPEEQPPGGVLSGKLAGLAASMKKRSQNADSTSPASTPLLEVTSEVTTSSNKPVDPSVFQIPDGFTQTEPSTPTR